MIKTCPLCRAERGYADTMRLNGLACLLNPMAISSTATYEQVILKNHDQNVLRLVLNDLIRPHHALLYKHYS